MKNFKTYSIHTFLLYMLLACQVAVLVVPAFRLLIESNTTYMDASNSEKHDTEKEKTDEDTKEEFTLNHFFDEDLETFNPFLNYGSATLLSLHAMESTTPPPETFI